LAGDEEEAGELRALFVEDLAKFTVDLGHKLEHIFQPILVAIAVDCFPDLEILGEMGAHASP
jgi:hypothetical protein